MDAAPLRLEEQICFALYSASRALTARYRELLQPLGVTYPQYLTLLVLWESGSASVTMLGERLHLESGTLSPLLGRMERSGLITRTRSADDERVVEIALTAHGRALRDAASAIPGQVCAATGLTLGELGELRDRVFDVAGSARGWPPPRNVAGRAGAHRNRRTPRRPTKERIMPTRTARTAWNGSLETGEGQVELTSSKLGTYDVSFPKRAAEDANGSTSPEELLAAAHSACYAMQFSAVLGAAGGTIEALDVKADVSLGADPAGGFRLTGIHLTVRGEVSGVDEATFLSAANDAKAGCPVSKALTGVEITLDAQLEQ